jgi:hypothetical protein
METTRLCGCLPGVLYEICLSMKKKRAFLKISKINLLLVLLMFSLSANSQHKLGMDEKGHALKEFYLSLRVEELWLSGHHINWEMGEPDNPSSDQDIHTHCSAFVAAACKQLNIYILRPPDHPMQLLANAQYDWLGTPEAEKKGWKLIESGNIYEMAQDYANSGYVVIATVKNSNTKLPGHIALVRPAEISSDQLADSGPMLIMASTHNFNYISLKSGFKSHIKEWPDHTVLFYVNAARQ